MKNEDIIRGMLASAGVSREERDHIISLMDIQIKLAFKVGFGDGMERVLNPYLGKSPALNVNKALERFMETL